jgi:hypothetical protein
MKNPMAPDIPLAIVLFAAMAAVALRAAARRPEPRSVPGTGPAPVTADERRPRAAATTGTHDGAGHEMARPPGPGRPASAVEQMQHVFHELHPAGRNALCTVCDGQYGSA